MPMFRTVADYDKWRRRMLIERLTRVERLMTSEPLSDSGPMEATPSPEIMEQTATPRGSMEGDKPSRELIRGTLPSKIKGQTRSTALQAGEAPTPPPALSATAPSASLPAAPAQGTRATRRLARQIARAQARANRRMQAMISESLEQTNGPASQGISPALAQGVRPNPVAPSSSSTAAATAQAAAAAGGTITASVWDPTTLAGLELWLDANDADTITLNGSDVSDWADKSASSMTFSQATPSAQPAYTTFEGMPSVFFNASSTEELIASRVANNGPDITIFAVIWRDGLTASYPTLISTYTTGSWADGWAILDRGGSGGTMVMSAGSYSSNYQDIWDGSNDYPTPTGTWTPDVDHWQTIMGAAQDGGGADSIQGWVHGLERTSSASDTEGFSAFNASIYLGNNVGGNYSFDGHIGEILIYNSALSADDRKTVEGYLEWKWVGTGDYLPAGHTYKDAAPTS